MNGALRKSVRAQLGRHPHPSAGALDNQTARAAATGGARGYDGGKRTKGRKKHIFVDSLGPLIVVVVTAASVTDATGARGVLRRISRSGQPRPETISVDQAYGRDAFPVFARERQGCALHTGNRPPGPVGFVPIWERSVVGRWSGWLPQYR